MLTLIYNQPASAAPPPPPPPAPRRVYGGRTTYVDEHQRHVLEISNMAAVFTVDALVASGVLQ